jgi:hypothetical protein
VIEWIISEGDGIPTPAAKQFKLPPGSVRSWWNSRDGVLNANASDLCRRKLIGAGRKGIMLDYDDELVEAILYLRNIRAGTNYAWRVHLTLTWGFVEVLSSMQATISRCQ